MYDLLGNLTGVTQNAQTILKTENAYAPFGEPYAQAGTIDTSFTGQNQDTAGGTTGLYDFLFREYSIQGRWPSPDPAGLGAVNLTDPRSFNRYAYVLNDPLNLIDPLGLVTYNHKPPRPESSPALMCWYALWGGPSYSIPCDFSRFIWEVAQKIGREGPLRKYREEIEDPPSSDNSRCGKPPFLPCGTRPQSPTPAQAATNYCQEHGQLSFNIPFTHIPVTISLSATAFVNFSTTNDVSVTFPPSVGLSLDITARAPSGPNIPVQVGVGKNASVGTFLTPHGPSGFSLSIPLSPVAGSPVTLSPNAGNVCGKVNGEG